MMCATCVTRWRPSVGRGGAQVFAVIIQPCVELVEKVSYLLSGMPGNVMLASSKCARYGSLLGTNHGPGRGEDEMGSAVVCPRGCRFCAVLWSENAANLPATNSALLVPIPREPLVPLVYFWSACMHPFVTALLGMSSLSQVDPQSLVSRPSLSVYYDTRPPDFTS